ncbi:MAG: ABC-type branched-subunit amino acid transport system substrate-binding protein [Verrucomicrobiales bacterium]|jgi:ABC-type branched-subunit amino acid transport system substrate-binding protein
MTIGACSSAVEISPPPSTVSAAEAEDLAEDLDGVLQISLGVILNATAPTSERDKRLVEVMRSAAEVSESDVQLRIETISIDRIADVESAVDALIDRGVTVIAASCDDSSMSAVVESAIAAGLLVVTGCVTIPRPELNERSPLFIDLAGLDDTPNVLATWVRKAGARSVAIVGSGLIPDVEQTCLDLEPALLERDIEIVAKVSFTGVLDDATGVVESVGPRLGEADVLAVCALTPSLGELVEELRAVGFEQPIIVPWFGDTQVWQETTNNVFVLVPASRYGDDPSPLVSAVFAELEKPEAVDVVAADTLAILAAAAERSRATGSRRLADVLADMETSAVSGDVVLGRLGTSSIERGYRVIEVTDGTPEFVEVISADG